MEYTIESLATELRVAKSVIKTVLGLSDKTPNGTVLTEAQVAEAKELVSQLDAAPETPVVPSAPSKGKAKKSGLVTFYWPNVKRASFIVGGKSGAIRPVHRSAKNGVMVLDPKNADDAVMIEYLDGHSGNEANGGNKFARFKPYVAGEGSISSRIDELLALPLRTLQQMAAEKLDGSLVKAANMSTGAMIDLILGLS